MQKLRVDNFWILSNLPGRFAACQQLVARANARAELVRNCPNPSPVPHRVQLPVKWPLRVSWSGVRRFGDFNDNDTGFCIVGERVRNLIEANALKGFVFREVECVKHVPIRDQAFSPAEVQGKFWALDAELTLEVSFGELNPIEVAVLCSKCGLTEIAFPRKGDLAIVPDGWSGHDAFRLRYLDHLCVSSRFRKLVRTAKLTLVDFFPLSNLGTPEVRKELKGPVSKRIEEMVRQKELSSRVAAAIDEGRMDDPEVRKVLRHTKWMKENSKRNSAIRTRGLRLLRESEYGYLRPEKKPKGVEART
jgi:hypothetical protein